MELIVINHANCVTLNYFPFLCIVDLLTDFKNVYFFSDLTSWPLEKVEALFWNKSEEQKNLLVKFE